MSTETTRVILNCNDHMLGPVFDFEVPIGLRYLMTYTAMYCKNFDCSLNKATISILEKNVFENIKLF